VEPLLTPILGDLSPASVRQATSNYADDLTRVGDAHLMDLEGCVFLW
jgi:hypothetical protein